VRSVSLYSRANLNWEMGWNYPRTLSRYRSMEFAGECLGQHSGGDQLANLGDGHGYRASPIPLSLLIFSFPLQVNETAVIRYDYGDPTLGTCKETILGGNHFRYWTQTGSEANRCGPLPVIRLSTMLIALISPFFIYIFSLFGK
jgi:hypothetical protein